jgi:ferritin-like metal-binding protein YciE
LGETTKRKQYKKAQFFHEFLQTIIFFMKKPNTNQTVVSGTTSALPGQPTSTPIESASGLPELFADGIKDIYWAENHLVKSLPKMVAAAGSEELKTSFENHLEQTKEHASRLEQAFELLGLKIQAKKCDAMEGLVMSGEHIIENTIAGTEARNTGLIMSALKVENFEITCYNGLIQLAGQLGQTDMAELLQQNLSDEMEAEQLLTGLSQKKAGPGKKTSTNTAKKRSA